MPKLQYRVVTDGLRFPEGPVVLPDGAVAVVEIESGNVVRVAPDGAKSVIAHVGGGPNGMALGPDNQLYVCNNGGFSWVYHDDGFVRPHGRADAYAGNGIQRVDLASGKVEMLYSECDGVPLFGPNDIVMDGQGGFWFTDHGKSHGRIMDRGALYYARVDGSLIKEAAFSLITGNGVGLSPDGKTVYATETETGRLWAWDIVGEGELAKEPWPSPAGGRFVGSAQHGYQRFDSLAVEADGKICVASLVNGGISVFAPEGGLVEFWDGVEPYSTNIAFGGADMKTAYITLSGYGQLIAVDWPREGLKLAY